MAAFVLPDRDSLQADLVSCGYKYNSARPAITREPSRTCASAAFRSPDEADAVALCFSEPEGSGFVRDKNFYQDLLKRYEGAYV